MSFFPGSISKPSTSNRSTPSAQPSPLPPHQAYTPTPQFSPPPPNHPGRVRWGTPEYFSQQAQSQPSGREGSPTEGSLQVEDVEDEGWNGQGAGVVLAITAVKGRVGCCYYDGTLGKLFFLEDQRDSEAWDMTSTVLEQILPSTVLTSANADPTFLTTLETTLASLPLVSSSASNTTSASDTDPSVRIEYRPPREFYAGQGKNALAQLHVVEGGMYEDEERVASMQDESEEEGGGSEMGWESGSGRRDAYEFGRRRIGRVRGEGAGMQSDRARRNSTLRLESFLNGLGGSPLTLGCAGALLGHMSRSMASMGELDGDEGLSVSGIELMRLDKIMIINSDALASLQIFADESHASMHSSQTKEGLSLFGILNVARTPLGRVLMRQWLLRPSLDIDTIEARHAAVECFLRSENQHIADAIQVNFRSVKTAPKKVRVLASGRGGIPEWQTVWQFLYGAIMVRDAAVSLVHRAGVEIVEKLLGAFDGDKFKDLGNMMNEVIDWEESAIKSKVCVKSGVDAELDELRRKYHGLSSLLSRVATDLSCEVPPEFANSLSVVYFPQLGYLINIPFHEGVTDPRMCAQLGWEFQFVTEEFAYFKSDKCFDLDRHFGDIHSFISDKEIEILHTLVSCLLEQEAEILAVSDCVAELDCLLAFAEAARLYHWNKPTMTDEPVCRISGGRHPLVEICVDTFVHNETSLVGGRGVGWQGDEDIKPEVDEMEEDVVQQIDPNLSMIVVTGANYSGKSIYLKQIALITYMAHLGCFVPAERALIGITDRILTRVSTRESITRGSSAFMIDLQQISFALRNATPRSLVIIDEFGKGTESDDGAGLFCAVMEHLVHRGAATPRVAAATHFHNILSNGFLSKLLPIGYAHMTILIHNSTTSSSASSSAESNLTYLYRVSPGVTLTSHAAACASLFGIPAPLLTRASQISHALSTFDLESILSEGLGEEERSELEEGEKVARRFVEWEMGEGEWKEGEVGRERVREKLGWVLGEGKGGEGED